MAGRPLAKARRPWDLQGALASNSGRAHGARTGTDSRQWPTWKGVPLALSTRCRARTIALVPLVLMGLGFVLVLLGFGLAFTIYGEVAFLVGVTCILSSLATVLVYARRVRTLGRTRSGPQEPRKGR